MRNMKPRILTLVIAILALVSVTRAADVVLDANTATTEDMSALPHMDDVLAGVVVNNRPYVNIGELNHLLSSEMAHEFEEYRPYSNIEQFRREIGKYVDEQEVARLEQYVTLD